jgi:two-component system chemotaxis response regulator CheY
MTPKIMTVDDSESIRQMAMFSLKQLKYELMQAANGVEALKGLRETPVNMLITDLDMPEMNGMELVRHVRAMPEYKNIPIIILTTESDTKIKQKAKAIGATGWITKPFTPKQLVNVVKTVMG